ncbi:hypothetical protein M513_02108 [Trichuris suis]|uniref:Uncharacterized protein n=1 Tax=Trichuris suis TaxID=68888 RepID=A0A085MI05_9BILA|nr:hypothetical protein M513_02108 [Trichuris suis]
MFNSKSTKSTLSLDTQAHRIAENELLFSQKESTSKWRVARHLKMARKKQSYGGSCWSKLGCPYTHRDRKELKFSCGSTYVTTALL